MKKRTVRLLLIAMMTVLVLTGCTAGKEDQYGEILMEDPYFQLLDRGNYEYYYTIYNSDGESVLSECVSSRCPTISYIDEYTIEVSKSAGTGVFFCTYYDILQDRISETYESPSVAAYGRVAYTDYRDMGDGEKKVILIVEDLFEESGYYQEYDLNIAWQVTPISHAEFLNQDTLSVTYLPSGSEEEITTILNLQEDSLFEVKEEVLTLNRAL